MSPENKRQLPREVLVEQWSKAPAQIETYRSGTHRVGKYNYPSGKRLTIEGEQVMDTCERPWAVKTVEEVFKQLKENRPEAFELPDRKTINRDLALKIAVFGYGLGLDSQLIVDELAKVGEGTLTIVELNHEVAEVARSWRDKTLKNLSARSIIDFGSPKSKIQINIFEGDSSKVIKQLYSNNDFLKRALTQRIEEGQLKDIINALFEYVKQNDPKATYNIPLEKIPILKDMRMIYEREMDDLNERSEDLKFDAIFHDTYPLSKEELGKNDLTNINIIKKLLKRTGVFTFFSWHPGTINPTGLNVAQKDLVTPEFKLLRIAGSAKVNPPPTYEYLHGPNGPVRELPVVICSNPKQDQTSYLDTR